MKKLKDLLRSRRGITITEVVVSMAMVLIISGAAISVLIASLRFDQKEAARIHAMESCESAVECVRFAANGGTDLAEQLQKLGFEMQPSVGTETIYTLPGGEVTVTVTQEGSAVTFTVTYDDEVVYEKET